MVDYNGFDIGKVQLIFQHSIGKEYIIEKSPCEYTLRLDYDNMEAYIVSDAGNIAADFEIKMYDLTNGIVILNDVDEEWTKWMMEYGEGKLLIADIKYRNLTEFLEK